MYMNVCTTLFKYLYDWKDGKESINESMMNTLFCIGTIFGTSIGGKLMQSGRNRAFIVAGFVGMFGSLLTFIINWYVFLIAKFICGMNYGMVGVVIARMIEEYVPTAYYGVCAAIGIMAIQFGTFLAGLSSLVLPPDEDVEALKTTKNYYIIFAIQPTIQLVGLITYFIYLNTDTPKFYLMNG